MQRKILSLMAAVALALAFGSVAKADLTGQLVLGDCDADPGVVTGCPAATYDFTVGSTSATLTITIDGAVTADVNDQIVAVEIGPGFADSVDLTGLAVTGPSGTWNAFTGPINSAVDCQDNAAVKSVCAEGLVTIAQGGSYTWTWTWTNPVTLGTDADAVHIGTNYDPASGLIVSQTGSEVPEPASLMLLGTGLLGMGGMLRRKLFKK